MIKRQPQPGVHESFVAELMEQAEPCPICDQSFKPNDLCATDIELGTCHAVCLDGSPAVHLETGEPLPEGSKMDTYRFAELATPPPKSQGEDERAASSVLVEAGGNRTKHQQEQNDFLPRGLSR